eukprot:5339841-Prymnesium_polylepis.1
MRREVVQALDDRRDVRLDRLEMGLERGGQAGRRALQVLGERRELGRARREAAGLRRVRHLRQLRAHLPAQRSVRRAVA